MISQVLSRSGETRSSWALMLGLKLGNRDSSDQPNLYMESKPKTRFGRFIIQSI